MEKREIVDLILKAAAIYSFILAVIALFNALQSLIGILIVSSSYFGKYPDDLPIAQTALSTFIISSIGGILKSVLYIVVGRNLYNGGSWLRRIFGDKVSPQT